MDNPKPQKKKLRHTDWGQKSRDYARYSALAFQMGATIALGAWGGIKLDEELGLKKFPAFTVFLPLLAIVASIYLVFKDLGRKK